ncbi:cytochrome-c peroxidase [Hymenobacter lapidiphilus]|uniref:Cytochrome-c peroxidase n=1 Tax=Hymenobacter lapidiphilus TaxID=2608003 RepID=A0A7Y7PSH1_9BACT|nr:cytochrome c peroxidase [Hymenobacter lapidiphilus]NVO32989.1 cytochrome-c peroxidase [Hymenobacter lapidiphilus]
MPAFNRISAQLLLLVLAAGLLLWVSCRTPARPARQAATSAATPAAQVLQAYQRDLRHLDSAVARLHRAVAAGQPAGRQRAAFLAARRAWKRVELLAEYYSPSAAKALNGPALVEVEEFDQQQRLQQPEGLQVLETYFYPDLYAPTQRAELLEQLAFVRSTLLGLRHTAASLMPTDRQLFDAARLEVFRVISLGVTGFDTPASPGLVPETAAALAGVASAVTPYRGQLPTRPAGRLDSLLRAAQVYLRRHPDAAAFDRLEFIVAYANPLSQRLWEAQQALGIAPPAEVRALRPDASSLFAPDAFEPMAFAPMTTAAVPAARAELGRLLFFDPVLSGNGSRSCASCHQPARAFTDGQARSVAFAGARAGWRNAPTLLNAALQRGQRHDGRLFYLEDQAADVLHNPAEMHGSPTAAAGLLSRSPAYQKAFGRAFDRDPAGAATGAEVQAALAAYVRSLVRLQAPLDAYMRGQREALSPTARRGAAVFLGKGKCATCHFLPLLNGTVPPGFERTEYEVLGTPTRPNSRRLDADSGRGGATGIEWQKHAFKTPTLRNIALTAPYMHQGTFRTLAEVIEFYDQGGGVGQGLSVPNQTLAPDSLHLSSTEKTDLRAFLEQALTDTTGLYRAAPARLPAFGGGLSHLNARPVGGRY